MKKEYITKSSAETKKIGEKTAEEILKRKLQKTAFVIGLKGELGGGKTTFLQGFAKGLMIKEKILSPTFVIIKRYKLKNLQTKFSKYSNMEKRHINTHWKRNFKFLQT